MRELVEAIAAAMNDVPAEVSPARFESLKRKLRDEYASESHDDAYRQVRYANGRLRAFATVHVGRDVERVHALKKTRVPVPSYYEQLLLVTPRVARDDMLQGTVRHEQRAKWLRGRGGS